jgi:hypothetical protein
MPVETGAGCITLRQEKRAPDGPASEPLMRLSVAWRHIWGIDFVRHGCSLGG